LTEEAKLHLPELGEEESDIILHLALSITQDRLGIIFHQLEMHTTVYNVYNTLHPIFTMHSHPIIIAKDLHTPMLNTARTVEESIARKVKKLMVTAASALAQKVPRVKREHK
jgi:hypothetical protein